MGEYRPLFFRFRPEYYPNDTLPFQNQMRLSDYIESNGGMMLAPTHAPGGGEAVPGFGLWARPVGSSVLFWLVMYTLGTCFTEPIFFGDTRAYTFSILNFTRGEIHSFWEDNAFWEFGHLLWRPLGWLAFRIFQPFTSPFVGSEPRANIAMCLFGLNWFAGLLSVLVLNLILRVVSRRAWSANLLTLAFLFSQAFLNFTQTGTSYIPGQLLLLSCLYVLVCGASDPTRIWLISLIAGVAFAGSVCLWFLYVLATPAVAVVPFIVASNPSRSRIRLGLQTCTVAGLITICAYSLVVAHLRLHRWGDLLTWVSASSHGVDNVKGLSRMVFGFARSLINMGRDGVLYKRFLLRDPYNPVSLFQLFRLSLGKFLLFYSVLAFMLVALLRSQNRVFLLGFAVGAIPVMGFALFWQGGDMERYLPLFPIMFITLSSSISADPPSHWLRRGLFVFVVLLVITNGSALSKSRLERQRKSAAKRISQLHQVLKPGSQVVLLDDELVELRSNPLHPSSPDDVLPTYLLFTVGTSRVPFWRQDFAHLAFSIWENGKDIWVSNRFLNPRPEAELPWAEGDDKRISWRDIYGFFSQLEIYSPPGGPDGFALVSASPKNRAFLDAVVQTTNRQSIAPRGIVNVF